MINALLYLTTVAIWGSTWLVITFQLKDSSSATAVAWRFLLAAAMLLVWCLFRRVPLRFSAKQYGIVILQGLTNFGFNYWLVYEAEARIASGLVAVIFTTLMVFNMIGARILFGQRITLAAACGALSGMAGVFLVFWPEVSRAEIGTSAWMGFALALGASACASIGNLLSVQTQKTVGIEPTLTIGMAAGGSFALLLALTRGDTLTVPLTWEFWAALLYLSLFGSVIAFAAYISLMARVGAGRASYNGVIIPIVALLLSTFFEGYRWELASIVGVALSLTGNILVMRGRA